MSLRQESLLPIPKETVKVAKAVFGEKNRYLQIRDQLGELYPVEEFAELYAVRGQPGVSPWRLAMVSIFQYMEDLSDEQAANAVRSRIDWKYALSLELSDIGFDAAVLSEFRSRLLAGGMETRLLDKLLEQCQAAGYLKVRGRQRTDSTHVLASVRAVNRLVLVGETVRQALNVLAVSAPSWLKGQMQPEWVERYEKRMDDYHLPKSKEQRQQLASQIGADGRQLLQRLFASTAPTWLCELEAVRILQRVWLEQYYALADEQSMCWREEPDQPPAAQRIHSPYDIEARYATKRTTHWLGYKVHVSESCDADAPHLITNVLTTAATTPDFDAAALIHQALAEKALLPGEHLLDAGYVDGGFLAESRATHQIEVIGPVAPDHCWQATTPDALTVAQFLIDWKAETVTCPQGHSSVKWSETHDHHHNPIINVRFAQQHCADCPLRARCTRSATAPRNMTFRPKDAHLALQQRRIEQNSPEFQQRYAARSGIEGTLSLSTRITGLRRSRYLGLVKTALQHIFSALALNLYRLTDWITERHRSTTRRSAFVRLALTP